MNKIIVFSTVLFLLTLIGQAHAQQLTPEEKAQQAVTDMQKRLGLKERQIQQVYTLNLIKIQKSRTVKSEKANNYKKLGRDYQQISAEYNLRLRSILTPEQFQRWEILKDEAQERRKVIQTNLLADNRPAGAEGLIDPETELEHLVTQ
jgi:protein CpxP